MPAKKLLSVFITIFHLHIYFYKLFQNLIVKGQLIPVVFVILLVAGTLIGYVFYNIFYGTRYQAQVFQISIIDSIRNLIEDFKNYLKLSITYSSHQSMREHACLGGLVGSAPWICNGPNPVDVGESKDCLEKYTKYYLDIYTDSFDTSLPVELSKTGFSSCFYDVDESGVFSGKYDEGDFWVNCSGAKIAISGGDISEYEGINTNDFITKDRYWYMFRIFYEWAIDDIYSPCICSIIGCACGSGSGEAACSSCSGAVEDCAERALDDLQNRFDETDEYVKCEMTEECCRQGIGPACGGPCGCQPWQNNCMANCRHECTDPSVGANGCPVSEDISGLSASYEHSNRFESDFSSISFDPLTNCVCDYWYEARLSAGYKYKCVDYKYYVPSDKGPVPLTFIVSAFAFWKDPCACWSTNRCTCPEDATECAECHNTCCTVCYEE